MLKTRASATPPPLAASPGEAMATCDQCKLSSPLTHAFRTYRGLQSVRKLCPSCLREEERRQSLVALTLLALSIGLGTVLAAVGPPGNVGWPILNLALLNVLLWATILPHEAGHALAARLLGFSVERVVIGTGRRLGVLTVFGVRVELHAIPIGGRTTWSPGDAAATRLKRVLVVAAGPLVHVAILWVAIRSGAWRTEHVLDELAPISMLIAGCALGLAVNLWPHRGHSAAGALPSDGAQLLSLLFGRTHDSAAISRLGDVQRVHFMMLRGQHREAESFARAALSKYPADYRLQIVLSAALLRQDRYREAHELLQGMLHETPPEKALAAIVFNNLAWATLNLDDDALAEEARAMSAAAYRLLPWETYVTSTHGCVEAFYGDPQAAASLLRRILRPDYREKNRAATLSGLAIAHARLGHRDESSNALTKAGAIDPHNHLLNIVRRRIDTIAVGD